MAHAGGRPPKKGLSYFPKDVDYYQDEKIIDLLDRYGPLGQTVYDVLLTMIYHNGYFLLRETTKVARDIVRTIGPHWFSKRGMSGQDLCIEVISYCAEIGLINAPLMRQGVFTSVGVQRRYMAVTARNKVDKSQYWLLEKSDFDEALESAPFGRVSATETQVSATKTPINAAKTPQKKISKKIQSKLKLLSVRPGGTRRRRRQQLQAEMKAICIKRRYERLLPFLPAAAITDSFIRYVRQANRRLSDYDKLFSEAAASSFLRGDRGDWKCNLLWLCEPGNMSKVLAGQYRDYGVKERSPAAPPTGPEYSSFDEDDFFAKAMARSYGDLKGEDGEDIWKVRK